jgi:hypothetical protein
MAVVPFDPIVGAQLVPYDRQQLQEWALSLGADVDDQVASGDIGSVITLAIRHNDSSQWGRARAVALRDNIGQLQLRIVDGTGKGHYISFPHRGLQFADIKVDQFAAAHDFNNIVRSMTSWTSESMRQLLAATSLLHQQGQQNLAAATAQHQQALDADAASLQRIELRLEAERARLDDERKALEADRHDLLRKRDDLTSEIIAAHADITSQKANLQLMEAATLKHKQELDAADDARKLELAEIIAKEKATIAQAQADLSAAQKKAKARATDIDKLEAKLQADIAALEAKQASIQHDYELRLKYLEERKLELSSTKKQLAQSTAAVDSRTLALDQREALLKQQEEALQRKLAALEANARHVPPSQPQPQPQQHHDPVALATVIAQAVAASLAPLLQQHQRPSGSGTVPARPVDDDIASASGSVVAIDPNDVAATDQEDEAACLRAISRWQKRDRALEYEQRATSAFLCLEGGKAHFEAEWRRRLQLSALNRPHMTVTVNEHISRLLCAYDSLVAAAGSSPKAVYLAHKTMRLTIEAATKCRLTLAAAPAAAYTMLDAEVLDARNKNRRGLPYRSLDAIVAKVIAKHPPAKNGDRRGSRNRGNRGSSNNNNTNTGSNGDFRRGSRRNDKGNGSRRSSRANSRKASPATTDDEGTD